MLALLISADTVVQAFRIGVLRAAAKKSSPGELSGKDHSSVVDASNKGSSLVETQALPLDPDQLNTIAAAAHWAASGVADAAYDGAAGVLSRAYNASLDTGKEWFFAESGSVRRAAAEAFGAWYLKYYGTSTDRVHYAGAVATRFCLEHKGAVAVGAVALAVTSAIGVYWYRSKYHRPTKLANSTGHTEEMSEEDSQLEQARVSDTIAEIEKEASTDLDTGNRNMLKIVTSPSFSLYKAVDGAMLTSEILLAMQTSILKASHSGQCKVRKTSPSHLGTLIPHIVTGSTIAGWPFIQAELMSPWRESMNPSALGFLVDMPMYNARKVYPLLAPLEAECGGRSVALHWQDPEQLLQEAIKLGVRPGAEESIDAPNVDLLWDVD